MTVSAVASKLYKEAKKAACKSAWNWRLEWSRAMKKAYRQINMVGSEKQVKWAMAIKNNIDQNANTGNAAVAAATKRIMRINCAAWWIDNRDTKMASILRCAVMPAGLKLEDGRVMHLTETEMKIVNENSIRRRK